MRRPDEHDIAKSMREQLDAPEDVRAHDDLTQLTVGLHEVEKIATVDFDHFGRTRGPEPHEPATADEHVDFAGELSGMVDRDEVFAGRCRTDDDELTVLHDVELVDRRAC